MSALGDYLAKQQAFNTRQATALDSLVQAVQDIGTDFDALNKLIKDLQASGGGVTPEDQKTIDALEVQGDALDTKLEGLTTALQNLATSNKTPPQIPVVPSAV